MGESAERWTPTGQQLRLHSGEEFPAKKESMLKNLAAAPLWFRSGRDPSVKRKVLKENSVRWLSNSEKKKESDEI